MKLTVSVYRQDKAAGGLAPKAPRTGADVEVEAADGELGVGQDLAEAGRAAAVDLLLALGVDPAPAPLMVEPFEPLPRVQIGQTFTDPGAIARALEPALGTLEELEHVLDVGVLSEADKILEAKGFAARLRRELVAAGAGEGPRYQAGETIRLTGPPFEQALLGGEWVIDTVAPNGELELRRPEHHTKGAAMDFPPSRPGTFTTPAERGEEDPTP